MSSLRYDSPPWLADQQLWQRRQRRSDTPAPLRGVSTQELIDALGAAFSPTELDWELVGVAFVDATPDPATPVLPPVDPLPEAPPWAAEAEPGPADTPAQVHRARSFTGRKPRKWLREHDEILAAVRDLSWEGYRSLIADIFRREGFEVFEGEGPDVDVIDMEVVRGAERMIVNCQLRGLGEIGVEPLSEMAQVAQRNGVDGAFIVSDGDFVSEAWSLADGQALTLIDRETLLGLVLDFTLGGREKGLTAYMRRLLLSVQPGYRESAS